MKTQKKKTSKKAKPAAVVAPQPTLIDLEGTAPGVRAAEAPLVKVNFPCVSPCKSTEYVQVVGAPDQNVSPSHRVYRCLKCGRTKSISVGGGVLNF